MNKKNCRLIRRTLLGGALLVAFAVAHTGCRSFDEPYSASFASVEIKDRTPEQIRNAVFTVFRNDGYTLAGTKGQFLVFDQEGSRMDKIAYGNWVGGPAVVVRVKVSMVALVEKNCWRLQCNAYMVRNPGDMMEDEVKLANFRRGPFQRLLDKVADQLKKPPAPTPAQ